MMHTIVTTLALGAAAALASGALAAPVQSAPFDGTWQVRLVTDTGSCAPSYSYTLGITESRVRALGQAGALPVNLTGSVARDGSVQLAVQHSLAQANASGQLRRTIGRGTWAVSGLGCSGSWTAQRQSVVAQAE